MVSRRRGGPADRPYKFSRGGLTWSVKGKVFVRDCVITLLNAGKGRAFRQMGGRAGDLPLQLKRQATIIYANALEAITPVVTGHLQDSVSRGTADQTRRGVVRLGPPPWRETRTLKSGKKRTYIHKYYARRVNASSKRNAGYIERAGTIAARDINRLLDRYNLSLIHI